MPERIEPSDAEASKLMRAGGDVLGDMSSTTKSSVIRRLEGRQCQWCEDGRLERDTYKGNRAAVCQSCETPAVQIW